MKVRLLIICTVVAGSRLSAQDYPAPSAQRTSDVSDARFEIVQSPRSRSFTFRIDRYTGTVWQLTQVEKERWRWEETPLPNAPSVASPNRARFQLHVSGLSDSQTILVDTESGKTWQFTKYNQTYPRQKGRDGYGWEVLMTDNEFERVHTVNDCWDGPRLGIADFRGQPHVYRSLFEESEDDWDNDQFELSPVDAELLALVLETWQIWRRFEQAFQTGAVAISGNDPDYGALPEDLLRHRELAPVVSRALTVSPDARIIALGKFRAHRPGPADVPGVMLAMNVQ